MDLTESIPNFRRYLKRKNYSAHTVKNYLYSLRHFVLWLDVPIEQVSSRKITHYIDHLRRKRLKPKTINCHLERIRQFYVYLSYEEQVISANPVKEGYSLRMPKPLPKSLTEEQLDTLFSLVSNKRDRAMFMLMLRCGLRVAEVANLTIDAIDWRRRRIYVYHGKGGKDRVVYISDDTYAALVAYVKQRLGCRVKKIFLVEKGVYKGKPISIRGIRKRIEYYSKKSGVNVSCHQLRHTMATQLLNADADLVTIQDLLGHTRIKTTQRYCRVCNLKVQRDYFKAMEVVMRRSRGAPP